MKRAHRSRGTTYWIDRPEQIRELTSTIRHEIADRLAAQGPMTVATLARALRSRPTAIYHHIRKLERVGLLRSTRVAGARGRPAVLYETVAPRMRLARAGRLPENRKPLARAGTAAAAQAGRDYAAGFQAPHWNIRGGNRNHWFFRVVANPSARRLERINELFDELAELVLEPDPHPGPTISVAWFLAPLGRPDKRKRR